MTEKETETIEVSKELKQRFEEKRKETGNEHIPPMSRETFLDSLLDTQEAVQEGYYSSVESDENQEN